MTTTNSLEFHSFDNIENLIFGQRIAYVIEGRGLSKAWVAERLGISKQALNYLLKHSIKPKFIDEFAELLALNPHWIETGLGPAFSSNAVNSSPQANQIPILSKLDITTSNFRSTEYIDFITTNRKDIIAFKLDDDSNFPPFIPGSTLILNTKKQPTSGDYVLFMLEDEVFLREYLVDGNHLCYKASNSNHKTFINPIVRHVGTLIEARYQVS